MYAALQNETSDYVDVIFAGSDFHNKKSVSFIEIERFSLPV